MLEVLDVGSNKFNGTFPCLLKNMCSLRVLVLRDNTFYGNISCPRTNIKWTKLQIFDVASNSFSGTLPNRALNAWKAMMGDGNENLDPLKISITRLCQLYYQEEIIVTIDGLEIDFVKFPTFRAIDVSHNRFEGLITETFGQLNALSVLNLLRNAFVGQIPSALGNISNLESLDLSDNELTGEIPQQLTNLTYLSFLNLSNNMLVVRIPTGNQFATFSEDAFAGIVVWPLMFWNRCRIWYCKRIDRVTVKIFPQLGERIRI
ncbi:hypothetical protein GH714_018168 [Hevea brasiliensis]|uniref:Uncharacterized protein n=1 Tax=Hevea brasiliensis TaxID=3981 RepID=A0A6A6M0X5_HEVBR|nr:hypothetical protein GH714_018168 [Hevea brasiliensis]